MEEMQLLAAARKQLRQHPHSLAGMRLGNVLQVRFGREIAAARSHVGASQPTNSMNRSAALLKRSRYFASFMCQL